MKLLKILAAGILSLCLCTACNNGPGEIYGKVYFDGAEKVPAEGVTIVVSGFIDNTQYNFTDTSDNKGDYHVYGIEPAGQYGILADFATATNIPENFNPLNGLVNDEEVQPNDFTLQYFPVEIQIGSDASYEEIDFTLVDF